MAKVYVETTIPSYLAARPSLQTLVSTHQQLTEHWWERRRHLFQLFVSELVLAECSAGDPDIAERRLKLLDGVPMLAPNRAILDLAQMLVDQGPMPRKRLAMRHTSRSLPFMGANIC